MISPRQALSWITLLAVTGVGTGSGSPIRVCAADKVDLKIVSPGETLQDVRQQPLKHRRGYHPFQAPKTAGGWEKRAESLRQRVLVANDLWPMPPRTPLNAVIHSRNEREGFTVEKVYFEAVPGFYVTGMLFRPTSGTGPFPGVLCPHGHGGRLQDSGIAKVRQQIVKGQERFEGSGRFPKLALCVQLARMGCVSFMYDMIGYGDSRQLNSALAHGSPAYRPEMESAESWGYQTTQAELRLQSIMGLQTWSSIRALDFLESLPDVDSTRIGVTGGSGGGTQTIILGAIDPRVDVAFPQGMVSTGMQGGCVCENTTLLRIGSSNVELAALFAPRPQAMTTADDWTKEMMTDGFPELKRVYKMLGAADQVECTPMPQFPHNFNYVSRAVMYSWMNKHLGLNLPEPIVEEDYELLGQKASDPALHVWDDEKHPAPAERGPEFERKLIAQLTARSNALIEALEPHDADSLATWRTTIGGALHSILGRSIKDVGKVHTTEVRTVNGGNFTAQFKLLTVEKHQEQLPVITLLPAHREWNGGVVLWLTGEGKAGLFNAEGALLPAIEQLLEQGNSVVSADLFAQGEFVHDQLPSHLNRLVGPSTEYAGFTYTYNYPLFAQRTHDVLSLVQSIRSGDAGCKHLTLVGTGGIGPVVAAAGAISGKGGDAVAVETNGFRFVTLTSAQDANFLPGVVKYGDLPALLALNAPKRLLVLGEESQSAPIASKVYQLSGNRVEWAPASDRAGEVIAAWINQQK
ncbi:glucuronyl esterase domain-containing protein [Planctomicrobium sp. SH664]|uniref:glucuronyl esterase domain-containing protein n=1 Tax=Planctomicrobium sp. SH664 TaxID=3448125 RepID=UPI003F5B81FF